MTTARDINIGWAQAFFTVLILWGLNNVMIRYAAHALHANTLVYSCSAFTSSALVLLLIGGRGPLARETMRSLDTWMYGIILLFSYILSLSLFAIITSTEGSLLQRCSLVFSLFASWLFLARTPNKGQITGTLLILAGIALVMSDIPNADHVTIYVLMALSGFFQAARVFVAEFHRPHAKAAVMDNSPKAKCRVVGFVMFVISGLFLTIMFGLAMVKNASTHPIPLLAPFPSLADFHHAPSILAGLGAGMVLIAPLRLFEFSSSHLIKAENFLAVTSLSSVATWFWESLTRPLTGLELTTLSEADFAAGVIITLGGVVMALSKMRRTEKAKDWEAYVVYAAQDPAAVDDSRDMIAATLEHTGHNIKQSAELLGVPRSVIDVFLNDAQRVVAFRPEVMQQVTRAYRAKVAQADPLTGLLNRAGFMTALRGACTSGQVHTLFYIDLNKFKPINDTYGHEAGDRILKGVADRLRDFAPQAAITRLGGDEFCILLKGVPHTKASQKANKLLEVIAAPFMFADIGQPLDVSASIGMASTPHHGTDADELLHMADKGMYSDKKGGR
ncbi:MAG: diguanylate cyclase [Proteobacteria bacterium]|nr:diguanylate cyclase [Pseudomonadota bacterium]